MAIYLDTSDIAQIEHYLKLGILRGVTTNPSIMVKEGKCTRAADINDHFTKIARLVAPYPVSVEVLINGPEDMIRQAEAFAGLAPNIVVKIPFHGPEGETENLEVIHELETRRNIRVNATAIMNAQQCILAALAGASCVSLFAGRVNNMGYSSIEELKRTRTLLDRFELKASLIAASIRELINVTDWLLAGADIVTVTPAVLGKMIIHPYTKETVQMFLDDAKRLNLDGNQRG